jgi:hypothetical protein
MESLGHVADVGERKKTGVPGTQGGRESALVFRRIVKHSVNQSMHPIRERTRQLSRYGMNMSLSWTALVLWEHSRSQELIHMS